MNKEKSWTRKQYEHCYRTMRRETLNSCMAGFVGIHNDIINAADYSYQAAQYQANGWVDNIRRTRFFMIKWRVLSGNEGMPS